MLGLYLHVPFCQAICSYCNFNRGLLDPELKVRYVRALECEIRESGNGQPVDSLFFGGGTPSLLEPVEVARLLHACRDSYAVTADAEVTLETNPETAAPGRLAAFREIGINRISFGVQSFDDAELKRLGRIHSADRAVQAVRAARSVGFLNLSFDLMLWLPGQTPESWRKTVNRAIDLSPDHLSLYLLELYPNAPLKEAIARREDGWGQADDDAAADMYLDGLDVLDRAGYQQYEISNVTRPGRESRHNLKYWLAGAWRGLGCGAHSTMDGERWRNVAGTTEYIDRIAAGQQVDLDRRRLSSAEQVQEALFTGLRLARGIDRRTFHDRYGVDPWAVYGDALQPHVDEGLMWQRESRFGLNRRGMLVANEILSTFV